MLASRLNSCIRKSSRRPTGRRPAISAPRRGDVRLQPVELLGHVGLDRDQRQLLRQPRLVDRRDGGEHRLEPAPQQRRRCAPARASAVARAAAASAAMRSSWPASVAASAAPSPARAARERRDQRPDVGAERGQQPRRLGRPAASASITPRTARRSAAVIGARSRPAAGRRLRRRQRRRDRRRRAPRAAAAAPPRRPPAPPAASPSPSRAPAPPPPAARKRGVERLEALGQPQPQVEAAAVDAARLPGPGDAVGRSGTVGDSPSSRSAASRRSTRPMGDFPPALRPFCVKLR